MKRAPLIGLALAALLIAMHAGPRAARAGGVVGDGTAASCTDAVLDSALGGGGLVTFDCGSDAVTIDISPEAGGSGTKMIRDDTTIDGAGLVTISGGHSVGAFHVLRDARFTVAHLRIVDGKGAGGPFGGGAILSTGGTVDVSHCTFADNSSGRGGFGGAIDSESQVPLHGTFGPAALAVSDSTFSGNGAPEGLGGAIANRSSASLIVIGSTFADNSAYRGGGIFFDDNSVLGGATLNVSNSTFAGNRADGDRGGGLLIYPRARGSLNVTNCTFAGNSAVLSGGGIQKGCDAQGCDDTAANPLIVTNTIIADNGGGNCGLDTATAIDDGGHNIDDGTSCGFSNANASWNATDPQLDPGGLADNGGPTQTIALEPDSPAIDAGDPAVCAAAPVNGLDQRGFSRPGAGATNCSIGAYELTSSSPPRSTSPCLGDCNGDGQVSVGELVTMVNEVLGTAAAGGCSAGNPGEPMTIADLLTAVNNGLRGCDVGQGVG